MNMFPRWPVRFAALTLLLGLTGCGTNIEELLYQSVTALGRTAFDVALTEVANDLADALARDDAPPDDGDGDGGNGDDGDDGGNGPPDGAALYANNCAACHGADGASGFAPDISGQSAAELAVGLESPSHGAISLTEDEVAAIAQFLGG